MPEPSSNPEANLAAYAEAGKKSAALKGIAFDAWHWEFSAGDPVAKKGRLHRQYSDTITFSNRETSMRNFARVPASGRMPMTEPYLTFAKSDVRLYAERSNVGIDVLRRRLCAHQFLERVLRQRHPSTDVSRITVADFELAESAIEEEFGGKTAYKVSNQLQSLSELIDARRLTRLATQYRTGIKRPNDGDELTEVGETEGAAKMVSDEVLDALAEISVSPRDDDQRLMIRIVDLLVSGGFRIGESLTLQEACLVEGSIEPRVCPRRGIKLSSVGIRYAAEKIGVYEIKWLPHTVVPLASRAIHELRSLTEKARAVAQWMERNPGRLMPFRDHQQNELLALDEVSELLFRDGGKTKIPQEIPRQSFFGSICVRIGDVEAHYLERYRPDPIFTLRSGATQMLSNTLIVLFVNQLHETRKTLEFLPCTMGYTAFMDGVSPPPSRSAAGITSSLLGGADGSLTAHLRVKSHQFRHWLSTLASNAGLSDLDLAKWMGRSDPSQNEAYKHRKLSTRTEWARQAVLNGKLIGEVSRITESLPFESKETYLKARIQAAQSTLYGCCVHNYAASPCTRHMSCLSGKSGKGCGDLLRNKGDVSERKNLMELRFQLTEQISRFGTAMQNGYQEASNWLEHAKATLAGVEFALKIDEDTNINAGEKVRVFNEPSKNNRA